MLGPPAHLQPNRVELLTEWAEEQFDPGCLPVLAGLDLTSLPVAARIDAFKVWERAAAWVAAQRLAAVAAVEAPDVGPDPTPALPHVEDAVREEIGCAVRLSGGQAHRLLTLARAVAGPLAASGAALRRGELSQAHVQVIADGVEHLTADQTRRVEEIVFPAAVRQTTGELRRAVAKAVLVVDAEGAARRAAVARRERRVDVFPLEDGMAGLWASLPAADATTVDTALDADADHAATQARAAGEAVLPKAARRADALVGWARRALAEMAVADGPGEAVGTPPGTAAVRRSPVVHGRRPAIQVTVSLATLLGISDEPGELAGYGPIDATTARRIAADGTWRRLVTDPVSGALLDLGRTTYTPPADLREFVIARDQHCTFPGCQRTARRCHLDHRQEWQDGGDTCADNLHPLCARHHTCKTSRRWRCTKDPKTGTTTWTATTGHHYQSRPPPYPGSTRPAATGPPTAPGSTAPIPRAAARSASGPAAVPPADDIPPPF